MESMCEAEEISQFLYFVIYQQAPAQLSHNWKSLNSNL